MRISFSTERKEIKIRDGNNYNLFMIRNKNLYYLKVL